MTIDLDERAERDDFAQITPAKRLRIIAEILAEGMRRRREDARRMGPVGVTLPHQEREAVGLELTEPVRLDRPPRTAVDALQTGESS